MAISGLYVSLSGWILVNHTITRRIRNFRLCSVEYDALKVNGSDCVAGDPWVNDGAAHSSALTH